MPLELFIFMKRLAYPLQARKQVDEQQSRRANKM